MSQIMARPAVIAAVTALAVAIAAVATGWPLLWSANLYRENAVIRAWLDTHANGGAASQPGEAAAAENPLIAAESIGRAGAMLQLRLDELSVIDGITISSAQMLTPRRDGDLTHVMVSITMQAATVPLQKFLYALETSYPLLVIDEMSIRALEPGARAAGRATPLEVTLVVRGLAALKDGK